MSCRACPGITILNVADFAGLDEIPHGARDAHAAEIRPAHAAEVACLGLAAGERLVVEFHGLFRVQGKREQVVPAEVKTGARKGVVAELCRKMALCKVGRMGGELVGDHTRAHVVAVGEPEVFLGRNRGRYRW